MVPVVVPGTAITVRLPTAAAPAVDQVPRAVQLEDHGGRVPGVPALPVHAPDLQRQVPADLLRGAQPRHLQPAHRGPGQARRRPVSVLLPRVHAEPVRRRHEQLPRLSRRQGRRDPHGV